MSTKKGLWPARLFGGIFILAGLMPVVLSGFSVLSYFNSLSWVAVPATMQQLELEEHEGEDSTSYSINTQYQYHFNDVTYQGNRASIHSGSDNIGSYWEDLEHRLRNDWKNQRVSAWVNPSHPEESVLDRSLRPELIIFQGIFGAIFIGVGFGAIYFMGRSNEQQAQITEPQAEIQEQQAEVNAGAEEQIDIQQQGDTFVLESQQGRHTGNALGLMLFGAIFSAAGLFLFALALGEGGMLWLMAAIFSLVGFAVLSFGVFWMGRSLVTEIHGRKVRIVRSLFGFQLYQRRLTIYDPSQVEVAETMSSTDSSGTQTRYYRVRLKAKSKTLPLAEGIVGREAAEAVQQQIVAQLKR